ncbi:crotonase/enoyl-CoA hydratase family protein [Ferrimicrobium sp.]|uniref:crotonase/enoyl-CoA hydratase family protein n=1 Tax=Ferrimicrobium sp. TaxID=2926050 RepID=UPI00261F6863|nr:crotonase/enoyl-CoA hydratase family protein [Ferrimicrobium sp.]
MALVEATNDGTVRIITINRPDRRNAIDYETAELLQGAFASFDSDSDARVAVLAGAGGTFCAGADLVAIAGGTVNRLQEDGHGPLGPTRLQITKPTIAVIDGYAVAGGLELALWCDLRVMEEDAIVGVFCRRFGVPLVDGGTVRLPRIVGLGRALDMILTGRGVGAEEALAMGLVSRVVPTGQGLETAIALGRELASFPQTCLMNDRASTYEGLDFEFEEALRNEYRHGRISFAADGREGARHFEAGEGRHGAFDR